MQRSVLSAALFATFCLLLAASSLAAAPSDPLAMTGWMTPSHPVFLPVDCGGSFSSVTEKAVFREGYPIDLGNGCGCPTLGPPWRFDGHTCKLQPGGQTCTGVCSWVRTLPDGNEIGTPTECGTL